MPRLLRRRHSRPRARQRAVGLGVVLVAALALAGCGAGGSEPTPGDSTSDQPGTTASSTAPSPETDPPPGMVVLVSDADVETTVGRAQDALDEAGMVVATVDHSAAAARADLELDPTVLVMGGNPQAGTPVMQAAQTAGVDLPFKLLVWQQDDTVYVGYNSVDYIATRAGIALDDPALDPLRQGAPMLAAAASGSDEPVATGEVDDVDADGYLVTTDSDADVPTTVERLQGAYDDLGLASPATVDHAAGAESVGLELRPTVVSFGGNSDVLPRLMQSRQTIGLDLPLRFLVLQNDQGAVEVAYPDIDVLAERHGLSGVDDVLDDVDAIDQEVVAAATAD